MYIIMTSKVIINKHGASVCVQPAAQWGLPGEYIASIYLSTSVQQLLGL